MRQVDKLLTLISHCNSAVINQNDYLISAAIIRRIVKDEDLSIEQISEEACISQATIMIIPRLLDTLEVSQDLI